MQCKNNKIPGLSTDGIQNVSILKLITILFKGYINIINISDINI